MSRTTIYSIKAYAILTISGLNSRCGFLRYLFIYLFMMCVCECIAIVYGYSRYGYGYIAKCYWYLVCVSFCFSRIALLLFYWLGTYVVFMIRKQNGDFGQYQFGERSLFVWFYSIWFFIYLLLLFPFAEK